jgi:phage baseplate assembly protein W
MPDGAITLADIQSADWSLKLGAIGQVVQGVADVDQCIAIILTTPRGSDPLRPTFGADIWSFLDYPIDEALPAVVREITAAIPAWEPRVQLLGVNVLPVLDSGAQAGAQLTITVTWQLKLAGAPGAPSRTQVVLPAGSV